jgi:hypothetical protein
MPILSHPTANGTLISVNQQIQEPNYFIVGYVITVGIRIVFVSPTNCGCHIGLFSKL